MYISISWNQLIMIKFNQNKKYQFESKFPMKGQRQLGIKRGLREGSQKKLRKFGHMSKLSVGRGFQVSDWFVKPHLVGQVGPYLTV